MSAPDSFRSLPPLGDRRASGTSDPGRASTQAPLRAAAATSDRRGRGGVPIPSGAVTGCPGGQILIGASRPFHPFRQRTDDPTRPGFPKGGPDARFRGIAARLWSPGAKVPT